MKFDHINESRDYAWKYFSLHADQRLKTFHFYVIISSLLTGAILALSKNIDEPILVTPICYLITLFSFVFWRLDARNKFLIKHAEDALKKLEKLQEGHSSSFELIHLFTDEESKTSTVTNNKTIVNKILNLSYSKCFNLVFIGFGVSSLVTGLVITSVAIF